MPNLKSAKKRLRQNTTRRTGTMTVQTRVKTYKRKFNEAMEGKDSDAGKAAYRDYCSVLDKATKSGVIKKNTAIRRKKRAAEKLRVEA